MTQNNVMSSLINLAKECPRHEKILIVRDYNSGQHILENITRYGTFWANFRIKDVTDLAVELVEDVIISKGLEILPIFGSQTIIDNIFNNLANSKSLMYFEKHPVNKGIVEALSRTVLELRLHGGTSTNLKKGCFIDSAKESDIRLILSNYENALKENNFIDKAGIIELALHIIEDKLVDIPERKYLVFSHHYMRGNERKFIERLCGDNLIIIPEDIVFGLKEPQDGWSVNDFEDKGCETDIERLRWLFASKKAPKPFKDGTVALFNAIGCRNEIREVLRQIIMTKTSIDDVEVVYTDTESYADLIYSACEKLDIPVVFSEGIGSHMTNAGRTVMAFLLWIKEDFAETHFRRILESGGLKREGTSGLGYLLRTSGVGRGRDRYSLMLQKRIDETEKEASDLRKEGEIDDAHIKEEKVENLKVLKVLCEEMLAITPVKNKDDTINFVELGGACLKFLEKYIRITRESDVAFIESAKERIGILSRLISGEITFDEVIEKLIEIVSTIRIKASKPLPGHLYVSHYRNGGKSGRKYTFIVGLDDGKFPEKIVQDPILLDSEREKMRIGLELSNERLRKNLYDMAGLMAGLRGKVTVSYAAYDIREDRKVFPSSIVLQIFRVKEGNPSADYNELFEALGEPVGFVVDLKSNILLDEIDWWTGILAEDGVLKDGKRSLESIFPGIKEGLLASKNRDSDLFTKYDGKIISDTGEFDPRTKKDMIVSCSRLELAAKCPFAYFIENVLNIRKPDETMRDPGEWLNAAERGNLLHEVFKEFIDALIGATKKINFDEQKVLIEDILVKVVNKYKDEIPPPNETIFQNELLQFKRDVKVFIKINDSLKTLPVGTEIVFGETSDSSLRIQLGDKKEILLRGKIDRIDQTDKSEYHVWDYKTGSSYVYDERAIVAKGQQLQPWLYAEAAEQIIKKKDSKGAKITISGYLTPTEKGTRDGKGGIFPRSTNKKEKWQEPLNKLLDLIGKGCFIASDKNDACIFCNYSDICGGDKSKEQSARKISSGKNEELKWWTELKNYE